MRTLKFKAQPTNAFSATVNQMFGGSSQLPTTAERSSVVLHDLITKRSALVGNWEELMDGSQKHSCRLSFEFESLWY